MLRAGGGLGFDGTRGATLEITLFG
jgi:hypothetical protein